MSTTVVEAFVRPAGLADGPVMAALHALSFFRGWQASEMAQFLAGPGCLVLLAAPAEGQSTKGMIITRRAGDEAEVLTLAVSPDSRRRGLARALLAAAIDALRSAGARTLFLEVDVGNVPACTLYESMGAIEVGTRKGYYETGGDARIFSLAL
jgi:ribosomal-protein-alanine N-acetyltransferase